MLNSIDRKYRQKINQIKTEQKGKTSHTKKINTVILVDGVYSACLLLEMFLIQ